MTLRHSPKEPRGLATILGLDPGGFKGLPRLEDPAASKPAKAASSDGHFYVTANRLHRQAQFHGGQDLRQGRTSLRDKTGRV